MKSFDNLDGDEVDQLLFDYLEGTLSHERVEALEEEITPGSGLLEELRYWKEAYVSQDFYDTKNLEESLQLTALRKSGFSAESFILLVAILTSFLSFLPLKVEMENSMVAVQPVIVKPVERENTPVQPVELQVEHLASPMILEQEPRKAYGKTTVGPLTPTQVRRNVEILRPLPMVDLEKNETVISRVKIKPPVPVKEKSESKRAPFASKISRKDQRAIERAKEKALQKKIEEKYMKGNKPYVVPLNPNF